MTKALALLSGGLDSTLAIKVLQEQGIEIEAINFTSPFCTCTPKSHSCAASVTAARQLNVPLKSASLGAEFLEVVKNPPNGHGRGMNPCIDCRILKFKKSYEYMQECGAQFMVTGEVLGQRPMSQRKAAMALIDKQAGVEGMVLRPLSAHCMPVTVPEKEGWVDRDKLLNIQGRSRKEQIALADQYDINDYPCPAGGCRLTEPEFAKKMHDLVKYNPECTMTDIQFLKYGRHFRIAEDAKVILGRNEQENNRLQSMARQEDTVLIPESHPGPLAVLQGAAVPEYMTAAGGLAAYYAHLSAEETLCFLVQPGSAEFKARAWSKQKTDQVRI